MASENRERSVLRAPTAANDEGEPASSLLARPYGDHGLVAVRLAILVLGCGLAANALPSGPMPTPSPGTGPSFSRRELEVLALLAAGLANKQIADRLAISQATVATHLRRIYERVGAHSRTQALAKVRSLGLEI